MKDGLKPCPFCGSDDVKALHYDVNGIDFWYIACHGCRTVQDPLYWNEPGYDKATAIANWNRRVKG